MSEHRPADLDFSVLLSSTPRGARLARLLADTQLRDWGLPSDPARLLVAELAANAVSHGRVQGRDFRLTLRLAGDVLRIEVADARGERLPELRRPRPDAESGRGLLLVDALAHRWGVADGPFPRKTVWAELRLATPEFPAPHGCVPHAGAPEPGFPCSGAPGAFPKEHQRERTPAEPTPPPVTGARGGTHSGG
ncbi:ATP-binding protein [Streptomyces fuscigenes]|nr:ATP-binding protein [Streptomyces fuscigenes]MCF3962044.1 ATP-binding protein [Streptomyces fuscigenes]